MLGGKLGSKAKDGMIQIKHESTTTTKNITEINRCRGMLRGKNNGGGFMIGLGPVLLLQDGEEEEMVTQDLGTLVMCQGKKKKKNLVAL